MASIVEIVSDYWMSVDLVMIHKIKNTCTKPKPIQ